MQYTDPGSEGQLQSDDNPTNFEEEVPMMGAFSPGESVKHTDPDTGQDRYGFIVEIRENGLYTVNFDDGTSKDLHEGWIMAAPEAPNADQQHNNYQDVYARLRTAMFPKQSTHKDWIDFKHNENEPQYGDWGDETTYSKDTHDNPFAAPKNRLTPPLYTVKATIPEDVGNPRSIAYSLQIGLNKDVEVNDRVLTIKDVERPLGLITELSEYGIEAETTEDLLKHQRTVDELREGMKVAMVGDFPEMNYFYNPEVPAAQAYVVQKTASGYILENDQWGRFEAENREIDHVRS
jgi:hypothetical protein